MKLYDYEICLIAALKGEYEQKYGTNNMDSH